VPAACRAQLINVKSDVVTQEAVFDDRYVRFIFSTSTSNGWSGQHSNLDSHADTSVAGVNCLLWEDTNRRVNVSGFNQASGAQKGIPIVTAVTLYELPSVGPVILVINEALWFGDDPNSRTLLNPNQIRSHGLKVHDVPRQFDPLSKFAIIDEAENLEIELSVHGVACGFISRKPTEEEVRTYPHYELTSKATWDPKSGDMEETEGKFTKVVHVDSDTDTREEAVAVCAAIRNESRLIAAVESYSNSQLHWFDDGSNEEEPNLYV
jgi:hypothetical protein